MISAIDNFLIDGQMVRVTSNLRIDSSHRRPLSVLSKPREIKESGNKESAQFSASPVSLDRLSFGRKAARLVDPVSVQPVRNGLSPAVSYRDGSRGLFRARRRR